jgi:outer membrane protein TolC
MFTRFLAAACIAAAIVPAAAGAQALTLDQALLLATQRSQAARSARAGVASATEAARAAGQLPDPLLAVGIDNLPVTGPERFSTRADSMTMKRVGISQEWLSGEKRAARTVAADAQVARETLAEETVLADTRLQAALAYVDAFYAGETLELATLSEHHVHEEFEAAQARLSSASGSSQEVLALTAARGLAEDESADVRQSQAAALVALARWVGLQPEALAVPALPASLQEEAYVRRHPAVLAAEREVDVARGEAAVAASNRRPNWTWQLSYGQRTGFPDMLSLGVNIPLPVATAQRQDRETAARLALVDKAEASVEEAKRMAAAEFRSLSSDALRLSGRIERFRASVIAPAQQRIAAALAGYGSNQVTLMTLFEARHAEVDVRRKLLALQRELARVQAQLAYKSLSPGAAP